MRLRHTRRLVAELYVHVPSSILYELTAGDELCLTLQFLLYLLLLHLGLTFQLLGESLRGEALVVDTLDGVVDIEEVLCHQQCVVREELQERHLLLGERCQLRHYLHLLQLVVRQLALDLKGTDGVDVVAEEVDTVGKLAAEGIDIEDASAHGKLPGS